MNHEHVTYHWRIKHFGNQFRFITKLWNKIIHKLILTRRWRLQLTPASHVKQHQRTLERMREHSFLSFLRAQTWWLWGSWSCFTVLCTSRRTLHEGKKEWRETPVMGALHFPLLSVRKSMSKKLTTEIRFPNEIQQKGIKDFEVCKYQYSKKKVTDIAMSTQNLWCLCSRILILFPTIPEFLKFLTGSSNIRRNLRLLARSSGHQPATSGINTIQNEIMAFIV